MVSPQKVDCPQSMQLMTQNVEWYLNSVHYIWMASVSWPRLVWNMLEQSIALRPHERADTKSQVSFRKGTITANCYAKKICFRIGLPQASTCSIKEKVFGILVVIPIL